MSSPYQILAILAPVLFLIVTLAETQRPSNGWVLAAATSAAFLGWSIYTLAAEGLLGFWYNHSQSAWGNQVWFDLLIAIAIGWTLLLPRARGAGMRTMPWLALIAGTGCIGLAAMFARMRYLEARPR